MIDKIDKDKLNLNRVFADDTANIENPDLLDADKVKDGFVAGEKPFSRWINYIYNWFSKGLAYYNQKGLPEWDNETRYYANNSFVQHNGKIWKAIADNDNSEPATINLSWELLDADVAIEFWKSTTSYLINDLVAYEGVVYKCIADNINEIPLNNESYWEGLDSGNDGIVGGVELNDSNVEWVSAYLVSPSGESKGTADEVGTNFSNNSIYAIKKLGNKIYGVSSSSSNSGIFEFDPLDGSHREIADFGTRYYDLEEFNGKLYALPYTSNKKAIEIDELGCREVGTNFSNNTIRAIKKLGNKIYGVSDNTSYSGIFEFDPLDGTHRQIADFSTQYQDLEEFNGKLYALPASSGKKAIEIDDLGCREVGTNFSNNNIWAIKKLGNKIYGVSSNTSDSGIFEFNPLDGTHRQIADFSTQYQDLEEFNGKLYALPYYSNKKAIEIDELGCREVGTAFSNNDIRAIKKLGNKIFSVGSRIFEFDPIDYSHRQISDFSTEYRDLEEFNGKLYALPNTSGKKAIEIEQLYSLDSSAPREILAKKLTP